MLIDTRFNALTHQIIGCAMTVHRMLGNGFPEVVYQRSLAIELESANLDFMREVEMPIFYKGINVGSRRVDFLVADTVLIELKAVSELHASHYAQTINYLEAYELEVGLLINFGEQSLKYKRFLKKSASPQSDDLTQNWGEAEAKMASTKSVESEKSERIRGLFTHHLI